MYNILHKKYTVGRPKGYIRVSIEAEALQAVAAHPVIRYNEAWRTLKEEEEEKRIVC